MNKTPSRPPDLANIMITERKSMPSAFSSEKCITRKTFIAFFKSFSLFFFLSSIYVHIFIDLSRKSVRKSKEGRGEWKGEKRGGRSNRGREEERKRSASLLQSNSIQNKLQPNLFTQSPQSQTNPLVSRRHLRSDFRRNVTQRHVDGGAFLSKISTAFVLELGEGRALEGT